MNTMKRAKVLALVAKIPPGRLMTYSSLAAAAGMPRAVRYMGKILGSNELLVTIPCHRVVRSNGSMGGYREGLEQKVKLLALENIELKKDCVVDLSRYLFSL